MNDYNDGAWWGWNGGECPVHGNSVVDVVFGGGSERPYYEHHANNVYWTNGMVSDIIAFRVTKPYVEPPKPREFWIHNNDLAVSFSRRDADIFEQGLGCNHGYIHVREVLPND